MSATSSSTRICWARRRRSLYSPHASSSARRRSRSPTATARAAGRACRSRALLGVARDQPDQTPPPGQVGLLTATVQARRLVVHRFQFGLDREDEDLDVGQYVPAITGRAGETTVLGRREGSSDERPPPPQPVSRTASGQSSRLSRRLALAHAMLVGMPRDRDGCAGRRVALRKRAGRHRVRHERRFHRGLSERWLFWAVDILHTQKVHTTAVRLRRSRAAPPSTPSARR